MSLESVEKLKKDLEENEELKKKVVGDKVVTH